MTTPDEAAVLHFLAAAERDANAADVLGRYAMEMQAVESAGSRDAAQIAMDASGAADAYLAQARAAAAAVDAANAVDRSAAVARTAQAAAGAKAMRDAARHLAQAAAGGYTLSGHPIGTCVKEAAMP